MNDKEFLNWIVDRLVHIYEENENTDFIIRLRKIANEANNKINNKKTIDWESIIMDILKLEKLGYIDITMQMQEKEDSYISLKYGE